MDVAGNIQSLPPSAAPIQKIFSPITPSPEQNEDNIRLQIQSASAQQHRFCQMTQYSHDMVFSDDDLTMIEAALLRLYEYSEEKVANGAGSPHQWNESSSKDLLIRVHSRHYALVTNATFDFVFGDGELLVLERSLEFMINHENQMASQDTGDSSTADKRRAEDVLERIHVCHKNCYD